MKKWLSLLLMVMVAAVMTACNEEAQGDSDVYKIGAIYSKTGPGSPLGEPEWNATKLLEKKINDEGGIDGKKVEIILADDESTPEKAMEEMNSMIHDEDVLAVVGSTTTGASLAMKGIAMDNEVPLISAGAAVSIVSPVEESKWVFKTPHSDAHAVERIYMHLQNEGMNKIAVLADSNAFGASGVEQLEALAGDYGMEIVIKESYNTDDPDMKTQLTKIDSSDAQAMVVWGTNPGPAIIAKNSKELGMDIPYIGSHGIAKQSFIDLAGDAAEGVTIPTGKLLFPTQIPEDDEQYDVISSFYDEYTAEYDSEPTNFGSYGYDNLMLVVEALKSGATDREAIRDYLENDVDGYVGATGIFSFSDKDHNGLEADSMVLAEVKDGKWMLKE
ncbi:ABC transporter substrate-binding protein [Thalassobacillus hwangdonensis]|uniref:ABC transporter substrate-binding protein n=1 Tax=Thalassobacillus hwangdonensis TaxID=546108 RepID=A0ABW3L4G4_9BACI